MKPNEALPEGRWLCPECELIDPAKFGSLNGGRKSSLDWFTIGDVQTSVRHGKENQLVRESQRESQSIGYSVPHGLGENARTEGNALLQLNNAAASVNGSLVYRVQTASLQGHPGIANQMFTPSSLSWAAGHLSNTVMGVPRALGVSSIPAEFLASGSMNASLTAPQAQAAWNQSFGIPPTTAENKTLAAVSSATSASETKSGALVGTTETAVSTHHQDSQATSELVKGHGTVTSNGDANDVTMKDANALGQQSSSKTPEQELLVVHGFVFARCRESDPAIQRPQAMVDSDSIDLLAKDDLSQVLKSAGPEISVAWPLAQIPFSTLEPGGPIIKRSSIHPKVLALDTKATYDPSQYASKYRKIPLSKVVFPGSGFQSVQLVLSDYEHSCNKAEVKRISDRLSPNMNGDSILVKSLKAELNLFDPYQMIRDYMLKLESFLNRAHLLNEFWGTLNKDVKVDVWQTNVRNCRSIPRLARLVLKLIDATHRRAFLEHWFVITGSKESDASPYVAQGTDKIDFLPLSEEWTPEAEVRKRQWEQSSLSNIRSLLAKEGQDVETWVYGAGSKLRGLTLNRRKRKQAFVERLLPSPGKTTAPWTWREQLPFDSKENVLEKDSLIPLDKAVDAAKKNLPENEASSVVSVHQLQKAIENRVNSGISHETETVDEPTGGGSDIQEEGKSKPSLKSRRSRRSGRLQTKKESPADFLANVIADSGKSQKDLSMETIIEAQKMAKLVEIKELSAIPFLSNGAWPVAGRLLFDPVGSISPTEMKRLGRKAGSVVAEDVRYTGSYEVGEVTHFHVWRKNLQRCVSFEQLVLLIRALESNVDKQVCFQPCVMSSAQYCVSSFIFSHPRPILPFRYIGCELV